MKSEKEEKDATIQTKDQWQHTVIEKIVKKGYDQFDDKVLILALVILLLILMIYC